MTWLDRLREAKELIDQISDQGAGLLRRVADATRVLADALGQGADIIDPTPGAASLAAADRAELEAFRDECERDRAAALQTAGAAAAAQPQWWRQLLLDMLMRAVEEFLRRRPAGQGASNPPRGG